MTAPERTSPGPRACLSCGDPLEPEAGEGLCSACLLGRALALASEADSDLVATVNLEGRTLGNYEILSTVAQGGMGIVFKARQKNPSRTVALKVISAGELATREMVERFHNEARAAARLDHPNIVPIYEVGEDRGWHYFSMQLIAGQTLADFLRAGRPEPRAAVELLVKVARAVEHAHQRGILHCDLKPTNILLDAQGELHLTDFGLAKVLEHDSGLTLSGAVLGTPAYMSPEQAAGKSRDITTATDVYGLGAIFYELLSGRPPFTAESTPALLRKIAEEDPVPLKWGAGSRKSDAKGTSHFGLPASDFADLSVICLKCLEKEPAKRYATAGELADELERWLRHEPIHARPARTWERAGKWVRRHRARAAVFATAALALVTVAVSSSVLGLRIARESARNRAQVVRLNLAAGERRVADHDPSLAALHFGAAWAADRPDPARDQLHRRRLGLLARHVPRLDWLAGQTGAVNVLRFSPDGLWLASGGDDLTARLWDAKTGEPAGAPLPHPASVSTLFFSPDGTRMATVCADQSLRIWEVPAGRLALGPVPVNDFRFKRPTAAAAAFSPDGRRLVVASQSAARVVDAATGAELAGPVEHRGRINSVAFSPDGAAVLTVCDGGEARLWDAGTGALRFPPWRLPQAQARQWSAGAFSPDGRRVLLYSHQGDASLWDTGSGVAVATRLGDGTMSVVQGGFTPDGQQVYAVGAGSLIRFWDADQGLAQEPRRIVDPTADPSLAMAHLRADSRMALLAGWDGTVRLLGLRSGVPDAPILRQADMAYFAEFSPDGRQVATADRSGFIRLWQVGDPPARLRLRPGAALVSAAFSPDGKLIMTAGSDGRVHRWRVATGESFGPPWRVGTAVAHAVFNPAGDRLAVASRSAAVTIWDTRSEAATDPLVRLPAQGHWVAFSPDGAKLLTLGRGEAGSDYVAQLWETATGGRLGQPITHPSVVVLGEFSPDGQSFLTADAKWHLRQFDTATGARLGEPLHFGGWIREAHFSPDGRRILSGNSSPGYEARAALLFELGSTNPPVRFTGHRNGVNQAVFSPDGARVATGSFDSSARIWDARTGAALSPPLQHQSHLTRVVFSPDGRLLATASLDGTARVWDGLAGEPVGPPLRHDRPVRQLSFSPAGDQLLTGGDDGVARVWDLSPATGTPEELRDRIELLSAHTLDAAGNPRALSREEVWERWKRTHAAAK